jgi:hypothetical protein
MRFAIAIGLLANTLPAASQSENVSVLLSRSERKERMQALLQEPPSGRGALVKKLNRGKKSSLFGRQRVPANQGILKNILASQEGTVECDPASSDADVGLLSCGMGNYCMESQGSDLGGFCVESPIAFDRELQANATNGTSETSYEPEMVLGQLCNESSSDFVYYDCDCDEFDVENNTGTLSCDIYKNVCLDGCNDTCFNSSITYSTDGESYRYIACDDFFSPYDEQRVCYYYTSAPGASNCAISLDEEFCTSCSTSNITSSDDTECIAFDCENVGMGSNACAVNLYPPIVNQCDGFVNYTCNVCPFSDEPLFPDASLGNYTCGELDFALGEDSYNGFYCSFIQLSSYDTCCNSSRPATTPGTISPAPTPEPFVCALCGEGMDITIPDGVVMVPTQPDRTCAELEGATVAGAINRLQCPLLRPFVTSACGCMPTMPTTPEPETPAPIVSTTPAPIAPEPTPAPEDVATPAPTDGVSSLLSSKSAMSLVGLSMAMVAYFSV